MCIGFSLFLVCVRGKSSSRALKQSDSAYLYRLRYLIYVGGTTWIWWGDLSCIIGDPGLYSYATLFFAVLDLSLCVRDMQGAPGRLSRKTRVRETFVARIQIRLVGGIPLSHNMCPLRNGLMLSY